MNKETSSSAPVTRRQLREIEAQMRDLRDEIRAYDAAPAPRRSRSQIIRGMISACDTAMAACSGTRRRQADDNDPDLIPPLPRTTRPVNPLRAADGTPFHRAPVGIVPRHEIAVSFVKAVRSAGEKMRAAYRPAGC